MSTSSLALKLAWKQPTNWLSKDINIIKKRRPPPTGLLRLFPSIELKIWKMFCYLDTTSAAGHATFHQSQHHLSVGWTLTRTGLVCPERRDTSRHMKCRVTLKINSTEATSERQMWERWKGARSNLTASHDLIRRKTNVPLRFQSPIRFSEIRVGQQQVKFFLYDIDFSNKINKIGTIWYIV